VKAYAGEISGRGLRARISRVRPKRSKIVELYTNPPPEVTVVCVDELGPVSPHALSLRLRDGRQTAIASKRLWNIAEAHTQGNGSFFGALRVEDGKKSLTFTSRSRNSKSYP
jgi:hypothetical protein